MDDIVIYWDEKSRTWFAVSEDFTIEDKHLQNLLDRIKRLVRGNP